MTNQLRSIRPFLGSKDFAVSRQFYQDLGFKETVISADFSLFTSDGCSFYLQRYYVKEWAENSVIFLEVADADDC